MRIFVLHYSKLIERKKSIITQFKRHNITDYEFIEKFNKEDLTLDDKKLFSDNAKESMISLMNKHFYAYKLATEYDTHSLILEDDVILEDNFIEKLNTYIAQLPADYDMLFIGDGCGFHIQSHLLVPGKYIYEKCLYPTRWGGNGASRCSDSYLISNKCAKKLCKYIDGLNVRIGLHSDWWLNVAARENNLKVYWAEPTIVTQGSENGTFDSAH